MAKNVALFIDCDRLEVAFMTVIFDYFNNNGYTICLKNAYVSKDNLDSWYKQLDKYCFRIMISNGQPGSNMKLSIDVNKALYLNDFDSIAIVSNYKEFSLLATEIRTRGIESICLYQYSKGNELLLKRAYNKIYNLELNRDNAAINTQTPEDMLDLFESTLEGLDTKLIEERLGIEDSKPTKRKRQTKSTS